MRLADTLQICSITGRTGFIKVSGVDLKGGVYMDTGKVTHCEYGSFTGEEALFSLLMDDNIELSFHDGTKAEQHTIDLSLDHILLEAARRRDEGAATQDNKAWARMITVSGAVQEVFLLVNPEIYVGRSQECDICIANPTVSSQHAIIGVNDGKIVLQDLNSSNGTYVNGDKVSEKNLKHGDLTQFGAAFLRFETEFDQTSPSKPNELRETLRIPHNNTQPVKS